MILIDSTYIHSFGGKTLLELVIQKSDVRNFYFLLDKRINLNDFKSYLNTNYTVIESNHFNRLKFYQKNYKLFSSVVCLSNVPPPLKNAIKTTVYFHNKLLLNPFAYELGLKNQILNFFKHIYIRYYNHRDYHWVVQTPLMKKLLQDYLKLDSHHCHVYPFFKLGLNKSSFKKASNNFVFISSSVPHKNHKRLIEAFVLAANRVNQEIRLHLTINKIHRFSVGLPNNLKIIFHGNLSTDSVNKLYNISEFAIYPSLVESFGLPLIEAADHDCKVIASDLPYVHEIIKPSLAFDPYSVESISTSILRAISENLPETKVLVENKLNNFMELITNQDVQ